MTREKLDSDLLEEDEKEPTTPYRSLGEEAEIDPDEFAFDEDDDPSRRRDPLRK